MRFTAEDIRHAPAERVSQPLKTRKTKHAATKLRASITPGTVLILLSGRYAGARVVFLKQLESGLLLVTGPYKVNGVPLRRVVASHVIATKTSVDVSKVDVSAVTDAMFKRPAKNGKQSEEAFHGEEQEKAPISPAFIAAQKAVDAVIMPEVAKTPLMKSYLKARFTLTKGQLPHLMQF
eukprot:gnl/Ergobibamus_cyprinoides/161.p2 GENE.gnl/Ergobibamus_cyprinoides/161~~gnl/Ergobibamus_cyprinoides/161.p2  ORF type:complete len:179 (+),score=84.93 gnl/Ergobibamus_cyprinoides/161:35-571(+)